MLGSSKYKFALGMVTITNTDPDGFAPNDDDLNKVQRAMEEQVRDDNAHLTFDVGALRVEVEVNQRLILANAVKPLQENRRIHR